MSVEPDMAGLLARLDQGDEGAAAEAFMAYEPYLRVVVRRLIDPRVRSKFDSVDVVQSVWADLLVGFRNGRWHFETPGHLKAFLVRVTRNRFLNNVRHHRPAIEHDRPTTDDTPEPADGRADRPSQVAQADDVWQCLLASCPPQHRELLRMKRDGMSLAELAERTGLHESSVRRILYDLARRFKVAEPA